MIDRRSSDVPAAYEIRRFLLGNFGVQIGANLIGALLCIFYFVFLDQPDLRPLMDRQLIAGLVMTAGLVGLGTFLGVRNQMIVRGTYLTLLKGGRLEPDALARARRRVLNAPLLYAAITALNWVLAALIMGGFRLATAPEPWGKAWFESARMAVGILTSGVATTTIVFFATEALFRRVRGVFFPEGGLSRLPGVFRLGVRHRLLYSFLMISVAPMIVVGVIFYHKVSTALAAVPGQTLSAAGQAALTSTVLVIVFVPAVLILAGVVLSRLVAISVADPVQEMAGAMARVREGDLTTRVGVANNDELGDLAESFNLMIAGLRERDFIKETFGKYVTREVRDEILAGRIPLDGVIREVTVMFADLRDFTPLVEATPPKQVVAILNGYFEAMTPAIRDRGGLVLQFLGDEIYAVFGAPLGLSNHARQAVAAAQDMRARLTEVNHGLARRQLPPLRHGIGLHTGQVLAANIGSPDRLSYLLVGDTVNVAARLQGLNKEFGTDVLLSATTRAALADAFPVRELPEITVKGKSRPMEIFALD
jgi:adenylate cyclase